MSLISIARNALQSQITRNLVGERTIDILADLTLPETEEQDENQNPVVQWLTGLAKRLPGFILGLVEKAFSWLLRNVWSVIVEATFTIVNFDWNQTDASLRSAITANNVQIAGALGQTLGAGSVWLVSVALATGAALKFPVLGGKIALALAEEGGEEIRGQVVSLLNATRGALARNAVLGTMLTLRRLRLLGLAPITAQREPWSIAGQIEERIESIGNAALQAFVENFIEGAVDALIEVGYVVSYAIDDFYSTSRLANETMFGEERTVKVIPDRNNDEEFVVVRGPQEMVKQTVQTTLNTHRLVANRDIGNIYGTPTDTYQQSVKFRPQVKLYFLEDFDDVEQGYAPISAEISFRLMRETEATMTPADAMEIATRIRSQFADGQGFRWQKGRVKVSYKDSERGYNLIITAVSEAEARRVINNVLDIQQHSFDADKMSVSHRAATPPIVPSNEMIYGQMRRPPRNRPVGYVRFRWAQLHVWGLPAPITLIDRTGTRANPLIRLQ